MVTISKKDFVKYLKQIQKGLKKREKFDNAMAEFNTSFFVSNLGDEWLDTATELLELAVGDKDDGHGTMISWFLYEDVEKTIFFSPHSKYNNTDQEIAVDVSTPGKLCDYFVKYGGDD